MRARRGCMAERVKMKGGSLQLRPRLLLAIAPFIIRNQSANLQARNGTSVARTRDTPRAKQSYTESFRRTSHTAHPRRQPGLQGARTPDSVKKAPAVGYISAWQQPVTRSPTVSPWRPSNSLRSWPLSKSVKAHPPPACLVEKRGSRLVPWLRPSCKQFRAPRPAGPDLQLTTAGRRTRWMSTRCLAHRRCCEPVRHAPPLREPVPLKSSRGRPHRLNRIRVPLN